MAKIAIIETGGKQYTVTQDSVIKVESLSGVTEQGAKIIFDKVLLVDDGTHSQIGAPYVSGATVTAELIENGRAQKIIAMRYRPKSRYTVRRGHRQLFAKIRITDL
jgi:large subunit ribosomal protein L21